MLALLRPEGLRYLHALKINSRLSLRMHLAVTGLLHLTVDAMFDSGTVSV